MTIAATRRLPPVPGRLIAKERRLAYGTGGEIARERRLNKDASGFAKNIRGAVRGLWSGVFDRSQFIHDMTIAIERGFAQAWAEGAAACGIGPGEYSAEEQMALREATFNQLPHLIGFAAAIEDGSKANGGQLGPLISRSGMWANRYNEVQSQAKTMACGDKKLVWTLGPTEHCKTCAAMSGKVKRASQWAAHPVKPQSPLLDCRGFNCQCKLEITDLPMSKGPLPGFRAGMPSAAGPGIPTAKPMEDIDRYLVERRRELEQNDPLLTAIQKAHPEIDRESAIMYADVMTLKRENFYKYAEKLGLSNVDELAEQAFNREAFIKREIAKARWDLQAQNTYKSSERLFGFYDKVDDAPLIGKNSQEAIKILEKRFGTRVVFDGDVDPSRVHKEVSRLLTLAEERQAVNDTMKGKLETVHYRVKPQYDGHTAVADLAKDKLNIWTTNHDLLGSQTLTHEIGHAAEEYTNVGDIAQVFGKGKRVSMYGWGNHSEDFAEVFSYYLSGEDRGAISRYIPAKVEFMKTHIPGVD